MWLNDGICFLTNPSIDLPDLDSEFASWLTTSTINLMEEKSDGYFVPDFHRFETLALPLSIA